MQPYQLFLLKSFCLFALPTLAMRLLKRTTRLVLEHLFPERATAAQPVVYYPPTPRAMPPRQLDTPSAVVDTPRFVSPWPITPRVEQSS